jgi:CheY-like chemotaxis protein
MSALRILCVHSSGSVLQELRKKLHEAGYETIAATDGETALRLLAFNTVDGIILSYDMEGRDGRLLRNQVSAKYPEIAMLLFSNVAEIADLPMHVFSAYLEHPGPPESVLTR